jgi:DNA-binding response OmpR family regulator
MCLEQEQLTMAKILLVEDDEPLARFVRDSLSREHYAVEAVTSGLQAYEMLRAYSYDLIILDWELPGKPGVEVCREFRNGGGKTPVLMLTGKGTIPDKEVGFDSGADDYLTKPFHIKELLMRLRALLRRPGELLEDVLRAGNMCLYPDKFRITRDGKDLQLVRMEFSLLEFFMRNPNRVISAEGLLERVWKSESEATVDAIRTTIVRLRKKIDLDGRPSLIQNVYGMGYKFVPEETEGPQ